MEPPGGVDGDFADDFVLEISHLHTGRVLDTKRAFLAEAAAPLADVNDDDLTRTSLDSDSPSSPRRPSRIPASPRTRGVIVIGLALLLCLALLLNLPSMRQGLIEVLQGTTPTPIVVIEPGGDVLYFVQSAPWGRLTVDGKTIAFGGDGTPVTLTTGKHTLVYSAAPFPTLRCTVSVPEDLRRDTCPLTTSDTFDNQPAAARVINIGTSPESLPSNAYDDLLLSVSATLASNPITSVVNSGEHYLDVNGSAVASAPLLASLTLDLNLDPSRAFPDGPLGSSCVSFCADTTQIDPTNWTFKAHVLAQWHFSTLDGSYVPSSGAVMDTTLQVAARWDRESWSLAPLTLSSGQYGGFCNEAFFGSPGGTTQLVISGGSYESFAQGEQPVDGCAIIISSSGDLSQLSPTLPADAALYIYRFGVILAGNDLAHQEQPQFPLATDQERVLALQWFQPPA